MTPYQATAEIFWRAFQSLSKRERGAVVERFLRDKEFAEDLVDSAIIESRRNEPSRSVESYLADRRKKRS